MDSFKKQLESNIRSLAVVRAEDMTKVNTALCDLVRYAHLTFADGARELEPVFADVIIVSPRHEMYHELVNYVD